MTVLLPIEFSPSHVIILKHFHYFWIIEYNLLLKKSSPNRKKGRLNAFINDCMSYIIEPHYTEMLGPGLSEIRLNQLVWGFGDIRVKCSIVTGPQTNRLSLIWLNLGPRLSIQSRYTLEYTSLYLFLKLNLSLGH